MPDPALSLRFARLGHTLHVALFVGPSPARAITIRTLLSTRWLWISLMRREGLLADGGPHDLVEGEAELLRGPDGHREVVGTVAPLNVELPVLGIDHESCDRQGADRSLHSHLLPTGRFPAPEGLVAA